MLSMVMMLIMVEIVEDLFLAILSYLKKFFSVFGVLNSLLALVLQGCSERTLWLSIQGARKHRF